MAWRDGCVGVEWYPEGAAVTARGNSGGRPRGRSSATGATGGVASGCAAVRRRLRTAAAA